MRSIALLGGAYPQSLAAISFTLNRDFRAHHVANQKKPWYKFWSIKTEIARFYCELHLLHLFRRQIMDPFGITLSLVMICGGLLSRSARKEAESHYNDAVFSYRSAHADLVSARNKCVEGLHVLGENRLACLGWQLNHIRHAATKLGAVQHFFSQKNGVFGGRTLAQVIAMVRAAKKTFIPPAGIFDTTVMLASGAALVVEGVQYLDKIGIVEAPMLHTSLNDVIGSLPLDNVHGVEDVLGGLGTMNIGDLMGDALLVFGLFKSIYNISKADDLTSKASDVRGEASRFREATGTINAIANKASHLTHELEQRSYDAYKWAVIAEEAANLQSQHAKWRIPQSIFSRLHDASTRLWSNLQQPAAA